MKQFLFLSMLMCVGAMGSLFHPFWGLLLYYTFAVLRPQHLWKWALPIEVRWSLLAAVVVILGVTMNSSKLILRHGLNTVAWLMILFGLWLLASIVTSEHPGPAMTWGAEYAKVLLIGLIASVVIYHFWQIEMIAGMILVVIGYLAWVINSLYIFDGRLDIYHQGFGGLDNNGAGLMLAMGLPLAYAGVICLPKRWQKIAAGVIGLMMMHGIMMSLSRGAMVSAIFGLCWLMYRHRNRTQAILLTLVLVGSVLFMAGDEIRDRFISTSRYQEDGSAQYRFDSWSAGWAIATDHPLTGVGIRNSKFYISNYGADRRGRTIHSQYIQIAADSGFPALFIYVSMLVVALVGIRRTRRLAESRMDELGGDPIYNDTYFQTLTRIRTVSVALEASLLLFALGAVFLSVEMFELPWIIIMLAGALPGAASRRLAGIEEQLKAAGLSPRVRVKKRTVWPTFAHPLPKSQPQTQPPIGAIAKSSADSNLNADIDADFDVHSNADIDIDIDADPDTGADDHEPGLTPPPRSAKSSNDSRSSKPSKPTRSPKPPQPPTSSIPPWA